MTPKSSQPTSPKIVFLVDVDNTLLDTDGLKDFLHKSLEKVLEGKNEADHFYEVYQKVSSEMGYVDIPLIIAEYCEEVDRSDLVDDIGEVFMSAPFKRFLFPESLETLKTLKKIGQVIIFSDGDDTYQKAKIEALGIDQIVPKGNIFIVPRKAPEIENFLEQFRHSQKVVIDDKASVISQFRQKDPKVIGIWVRQGRYRKIKAPKPQQAPQYEAKSISEVPEIVKKNLKL